jgi:hypothetical protein
MNMTKLGGCAEDDDDDGQNLALHPPQIARQFNDQVFIGSS